jgi:hypothetical protein
MIGAARSTPESPAPIASLSLSAMRVITGAGVAPWERLHDAGREAPVELRLQPCLARPRAPCKRGSMVVRAATGEQPPDGAGNSPPPVRRRCPLPDRSAACCRLLPAAGQPQKQKKNMGASILSSVLSLSSAPYRQAQQPCPDLAGGLLGGCLPPGACLPCMPHPDSQQYQYCLCRRCS